MIDIKSNKAFVNYALKHIENPLCVTVTGSRMYGFCNCDSDWDVYSVFVEPCINLFRLNKPRTVFTTPEVEMYNKKISVKVEEIEEVIVKLLKGDAKTIERIVSPIVTMETKYYFILLDAIKKLITQKVFQSYLEHIDECVELFQTKKQEKYLLYALRLSLTASTLSKTNKIVLECSQLETYFPNTTLHELIEIKVSEQYSSFTNELIQKVYEEIEYNKKIVIAMRGNFNIDVDETVIKELDDFLVLVRLEHTYSEKYKMKLMKLD